MVFDSRDIIAESTVINDVNATDIKSAAKENSAIFSPQSMSEQIEWEKMKMIKKDKSAERAMRENYARKSFWFSGIWAVFLAALIAFQGFGERLGFKLTSTEFLTIIGTLSATILGYYIYVLTFLFKK